jgi:hypothetical protein
MKVLITGFNALTIGTARSPLNIATSAKILPTVLKELGYDVTQKAIIPGEDVSMYDKVIVYVFGPNSLSARYWYGAAYTIIKRPDAIISIDDWQTKDSVSGFGTFSRGHWRIWKKLSKAGNPVGKMYWEEAQPYKKEIEDFVDAFAFEKWPHKLLIPAYDGGNFEELGLKANEIVNWDPSPYTDTYLQSPEAGLFDSQPPPIEIKEKAWILASLVSKQSWLKKQTFSWPIKTFGNVKEKQPRLKEHELYQEYRKVWGIISPPHYHTMKGSGWWRVRYKMAYDAKSIILAHPEEAKVLGINIDHNIIEKGSNWELNEIISSQNEILKNKFWTKERTKEFFKCLLES